MISRLPKPFLRFLLAGFLNSAITYVLFLALTLLVHHLIAYTIVYAFGVILSYALNTKYVFRTEFRWQSAAAFPLIYAAQYLWGMGLLFVLVDQLGLRKEISILVVMTSSVVMTYTLTRRLLNIARS